MKDARKTKEQLINELAELRQRIAELEASETEYNRAEKERERLLATEHEQRLLAETLAEVTLALASQTSHATVLDEILRQVQRIVPYSMAKIMLLERDALHIACWQGYEPFGRENSISSLVLPLADFPLDAQAVRSRHPLVVPDTHQDPRWVVTDEMAWIKSTIMVPICLRDRVLGLLTLDSDTPGEFSAEDAERLQPLANAAAIALENARLFTATRRQAEQLEALRQVELELTAQLDLDTLLRSIASRAVELLGGAAGGLELYRPERDALEWTAVVGSNLAPVGTILHRGEGLSGKVWETGEPLIVNDYQHWEGRAATWKGYHVPAAVGVPVYWGEEFLGVLTVQAKRPRTFSPADTELLSLFATQAAIAIRNARLYTAERKQVTQLAVVNRVARKATSILDPDLLLQEIVTAIRQGFGYYNVALFLLDETDSDLEMRAIDGGFEALVSPDYRQVVGIGMIGSTATTGRPLLANDVSQEPRYVLGFLEEVLTRSELCVPLKLAGQVIGVLDVQDTQLNVFDETDLIAMKTLADQIAVAMKNAHLYEEFRSRTEELAVLNELAQALTACLNVKAVLDAAYRGTSRLLDTTNFYIALYDPDRNDITLAIDVTEGRVRSPHTTRQSGQGLTEYIIRNHTPLLIRENLPQRLEEMGVELIGRTALSWLGVPLIIGDRMLGVMVIQSYTTPCAYDEHDQDMLTAIASQTAVALENARLYEETQRRALEQKTLREATLALTTALDRDEVIERILAQLQEVVPYDTASVQLLRDDRLEIAGGRGFPNLPDLLGLSFPVDGDNPNSQVVRTHAPFIVADGPAVYEEFRHEPHAQACIRSWLGVPMLVSERLVGMIALDKREPGFYTQEHARLAEAFAAQAAVAVENSRLFQAEREQRELAEALEKAAAAVSSTLDLDQVIDHILEQVERVVPGNTFNVMLVEGDIARRVRERGYEHLDAAHIVPYVTIPLAKYPSLSKMRDGGEPIIIPDTSVDSDWVPSAGGEWRRSYVAAPIRVGDTTVGFLNVSGNQPGQFGPADAQRLKTFASHAAAAIENAQLYREVRDHAQQLEERIKERTAEIQAQYARLDTILRSVSDGIVVTGGRGEILQANPIAHTWLTQTLSPEDAARLREAVQYLARRAEEQPETVLELTGLDLELRAAPISEPRMEKAAAVVAVHDVSHLKALDRMKTHFVSNVSHELRTPATTIKLYAHLMQRTPPTEEKKWERYLDALVQEANQQARLVEDILQISRIDAGRLEIEPRPTLLNELAEKATVSHHVPAQERELTLEHHPAEPGPVALVDPERMMQVLNNLVENAIHHTPTGGKVMISTGKEEAKGRVWATVSVTDTGMGISEEELPHIFERFFRGEKPRVMQIPGTGLGLAIVKEIVELHGGRVTVESQVDKGTTFTIWLPLAG